jgi:hypothetical protein
VGWRAHSRSHRCGRPSHRPARTGLGSPAAPRPRRAPHSRGRKRGSRRWRRARGGGGGRAGTSFGGGGTSAGRSTRAACRPNRWSSAPSVRCTSSGRTSRCSGTGRTWRPSCADESVRVHTRARSAPRRRPRRLARGCPRRWTQVVRRGGAHGQQPVWPRTRCTPQQTPGELCAKARRQSCAPWETHRGHSARRRGCSEQACAAEAARRCGFTDSRGHRARSDAHVLEAAVVAASRRERAALRHRALLRRSDRRGADEKCGRHIFAASFSSGPRFRNLD